MDQGQDRRRSRNHQELADRRGAEPSAGEDSLLGIGRGRNQERDRGLSQEAGGATRGKERRRHAVSMETTQESSQPGKTPSVSVSPQAVDAIARQLKKRGTPDASLRL